MSTLKLMIPGPVDVPDDVRQAMESPTIPHYGEAWVALYREVIRNLKQIHGTEHELYLLLGSGTAGLDAALGSTLYRDEKVLMNSNWINQLGIVPETGGVIGETGLTRRDRSCQHYAQLGLTRAQPSSRAMR